ncbi:hypothetical protein AMAG_05668 [Allomyces macrogynus ATCC 38327]|uniref:Uncharacterized protein n=1 Tax=Allomyces macrogynus (strain ATCC 38327) TaxID=578462 RepID=A0A0L0SCT9_ALLM3|nr:hypothetical protein AMAG_05668 [Allomyces macrogynus ATCC 38327]|eukprot:KNE60257.1 hypothetical protein AMAG_05668 [Allomyces macrogynus ATCC 38327]
MGHGMSRGDHPASHVVAWRAYTAMERNVMQMIVEAAAARPRPAALPVPIAQLPPPLRQALSHLDSAALVPVDAVLALLPWQTLDPSPGEDPDLVFRSPTPAATATTAPGMGSPPPGATLMRRGGAVFPATTFESTTLRGLSGTMGRAKRTTMLVVDEDGNPVDLFPPGTVPVFPDEVPLLLSELENTVNVGLCSRDLVELTPSLAMLRNASVLQLTSSPNYPPRSGHLAHLIELDVSQNVLTDLPTSIGRLRRLHVLKADRNRLTALPAQLGRLTALVTLDVSENPLRVLPAELATLKHLRKVRTRGCPLWSARAAAAAPGRVMPLGIDPENDVAAAGPGAGLPPPLGLPADLGAGLAAHVHAHGAAGADQHQPRTLSRRAAAAAALAAIRPTSDELGLPASSDDKQWTGILSLREMVARTLIRTNAVVDLAQLPRDLAAHLRAEVGVGETMRRRLHDAHDETDDEQQVEEVEEEPEEDLAAWDPDLDVERYDVYDVLRGGLPTTGPIRALIAMRRLPPLLDPRPSPSDLAKATAATRPKWFPTATPTTTANPIPTPTYGLFTHPRAASAPPLRSTPLPYDAPLAADDSMLLFGTAPRRTRARSGSYFDWDEAGSASASTSLAPAAEAHTLPAGIEPALSATSMSVTLPTLAASTPSSRRLDAPVWTAPRRTRPRSGSYFDWDEAGSASASTSLAPAAEAHTLPAGIEPALSATSMSVTLPTLAASTPSSSVPVPAGSSPAPSVVAAAAAGGAWMVDDLEPAPLEPDAVDGLDAAVLEQVLAADDEEPAAQQAAPRTSRGSKTSVSSSVVAGLAGLAARVRFGRWRASSASSSSGGAAGRARAGRDGDAAGAAASGGRGARY